MIQVTLPRNLVPLMGHLIYGLKNSNIYNHIATTRISKQSSIKSYSIGVISILSCKKPQPQNISILIDHSPYHNHCLTIPC